MSFTNTLKFLWNHPSSKGKEMSVVGRYFGWQFSNILFKRTIIFEMITGVKMYLRKGMRGASGNYYCGLHEYEEMKFLLRHLHTDDLFVDVGANVGSYTMLAAAGRGARVIAIEPVSETAKWILKNAALNKVENQITLIEKVIGASHKEVNMITHLDTMNHVVPKKTMHTMHFEQITLDEVVQEEDPVMIKIDVEGYELEVLRGMKKTLQKPSLKYLMIETQYFEGEPSYVMNMLGKLGFQPYQWDAANEKLLPWKHRKNGIQNVIFQRVLD